VIKKTKPVKRYTPGEETTTEDNQKEIKKTKGLHTEKTHKANPNKRQFDKHSGTGRGKEISKQGSGGKGTWGTNTKTLAKEGERNFEAEEERFGRYEDRFFENALNPKVKEVKEEKPTVEESKTVEDTKESKQVEETAPQEPEKTEKESEDWRDKKEKKDSQLKQKKKIYSKDLKIQFH